MPQNLTDFGSGYFENHIEVRDHATFGQSKINMLLALIKMLLVCECLLLPTSMPLIPTLITVLLDQI